MTTEQGERTTALIRVQPDADEAILKLHAEALGLETYAKTRVIVNDQDVKNAMDDLSLIAKLTKALEDKRKEYTGPINAHLKAISDTFKLFSGPIERANAITRAKILDYRKEQERFRLEQERINQLRLEAARAEMELKGEVTEPTQIIEVAPVIPAHYRTEMGTLGTAKIWKFEVVDFALLPNDYKVADMVKIRKVVAAGATIPGVKAWQDESLRITTK